MRKMAFHGGVYKMDLGEGIGSEQEGERPCICVSNDANNMHSNTIQVVPLTSQTKNSLPVHYTLTQSKYRFLVADSTALVEQITTKSIQRITGFLGRIDSEDLLEIKQCISKQFNL